jgi:hypothetical protein
VTTPIGGKQKRGAELRGYVIDVKPGGKETCNCKSGDVAHRDTHIELVADPNDSAPERRVIVEVSPRWRAKMLQQGVDWSTATLRNTFKDHWVTVKGWLLFDAEHANQAENTDPGGDANWRATSWEVHPITSLALASGGTVSLSVSPPGAGPAAGPVAHISGKVAQVDPTGGSISLLSGGKIQDFAIDSGSAAATTAKRLKTDDLVTVEATPPTPAKPQPKVTKIDTPRYGATAFGIAGAILVALIVLLILSKFLLGLRSPSTLILGFDGRYSNSKFQMCVWFGVLIVTYLATVFLRFIGSNGLLVGSVDLPTNLLMISGLSALSFAGAKAITEANKKKPGGAATKEKDSPRAQGKTAGAATAAPTTASHEPHQGAEAKAEVSRPPATMTSSFPGDLVNDDYGIVSFARFQIMVITFVAVIVYIAQVVGFLRNLPLAGSVAIPDVDTTILAAFGLGQGAYLTNKVVSPES